MSTTEIHTCPCGQGEKACPGADGKPLCFVPPEVEIILKAWRIRFPNNMYSWPAASFEFAFEAVKALNAATANEINNRPLTKEQAEEMTRRAT